MSKSEYLVDSIEDGGKRHFSVDLNLNEAEQVSLSVALKDILASNCVKMIGDKVVSSGTDFYPESHLGQLVNLAKRVDAIRCGRRTWNNGRGGAR